MRPTTLMMSQKKPEQKQGTALSFADVIPSRLPAQCPHQCIFYGKATQGENPSFDIPQTVNPVDGTASVRGKNLFKWQYRYIGGNHHGAQFADDYFVTMKSGLNSFVISAANKITEADAICYLEDGTNIQKPMGFSALSFKFSIRDNHVYFNSSGAGNPYYTFSSDVVKIKVSCYGKIVDGWVGTENGDKIQLEYGAISTPYSPYQEPDTLAIPPLYGIEFHDGINDNVSWVEDGVTHYAVADTYEPCVLVSGEYKSRKTIRVGKVDLGSLEWTAFGTDEMTASLPSLVLQGDNNVKTNMFCSIYTAYSFNDVASHDSSIGGGNDSGTKIVVKDSRYGQNTAAYKTAMSGTYLYYPSNANPVVTLGDPVFVSTKQGTTNINLSSAVQGQIKASVLKKR